MTNAKSLMNTTMPLSQAMKEAPNVSGCYQIYQGDKLVYVGKAQDGIRKRFVQYYNGTTAHYSSAERILANKDNLSVKWKVIEDSAMVTEQEAKWIRSHKPEWNVQSGWGEKGVLSKNNSQLSKASNKGKAKANPVTVGAAATSSMAPELALAKVIGSSAMNAAGGAVVGTTIVETAKAIKNNDDASTTVGNVAGQGTRAFLSAGGGAVVGELVGLGAIALGAGPIGWALAAGGGALAASKAISDSSGGVAEKVSSAVSDGMDNLRLNSVVVDGVCDIAENISLGLGSLWDNTFGSWFL